MEPTSIEIAAPEIEMAVLYGLLTIPITWSTVGELLREELFKDPKNRDIYRAAAELNRKGAPVEFMMVAQKLRESGKLDAQHLSGVLGSTILSSNVEHHVRILIEYHIKRELLSMGTHLVQESYRGPDAFDLLDVASAKVTDLYAVTQPTQMRTAATGIEDLTDGNPPKHYTYGIKELDEVCVFECGLPHVFAGRPGIGKSIFCLEVCWHLTLAGPVLLFSPEMTLRQVQARIIARETGIPYKNILRKKLDEQQMYNVADAAMRLHDRMQRLKVDTTGGITPTQVRIRTERAIKAEGVIAMAIDHLHKMKTGDARVDSNDFGRISQCMNGVTEVAKNTELPALVMCQLNREVEKRNEKRPTMADLRGSGEIEQDAAVIGLMYREGYYLPEPPFEDRLEIAVAKNRDGAVGLTACGIIPAYSRIMS